MNEIIRPDELGPAQLSTVDLRVYCDHASKMRESADISRIAGALVRAQADMVNPSRNRAVQVRTQAGSYQFRYATLDKITDMIRPVLAENGLCVLQPIVSTDRGPVLLTRLLHESGQWMECEIPLPAMGPNPQGFGSAVTYMRRYSITALLNISADEDDDANRAAGNHYQDLPTRRRGASGEPDAGPARGRPAREAAEDRAASLAEEMRDPTARTLVERARVAESVEDGHELLETWLKHAAGLEKLRGTRSWEVLERELGSGLRRSLGTEPASAFVAAIRATEPAQVGVLQTHWEGKWAHTLAAMEQEAPQTFALLRKHTAVQVARVQGAQRGSAPGAERTAPATERTAPATERTAPATERTVSAAERGSSAASARDAQESAAGAVADSGRPDGFEAHLVDEAGDVASDLVTDPVAFARLYRNAWTATETEARAELARHNGDALARARRAPAARTVLEELGADALPAEDRKAGGRKAAPRAG